MSEAKQAHGLRPLNPLKIPIEDDNEEGKPTIILTLEEDDPTVRITAEIPESYAKALRMRRMAEKRTQNSLVTEGLRYVLSREIRSIDEGEKGKWWKVKND